MEREGIARGTLLNGEGNYAAEPEHAEKERQQSPNSLEIVGGRADKPPLRDEFR
jgi:hypothetical protein